MIIEKLLFCFFVSILVSEFFSRSKVFYTRFFSFFLIHSIFTAAVLFHSGITMGHNILIGYLLSNIPLLVAWFGFRVHLSNSITLTLLLLLEKKPLSRDELFDSYNVAEHISKRLEELKNAGYIINDESELLSDSYKAKTLCKVVKLLRG